MDRFQGLSVFVAAIEGGSIAAAGRRCGLSAVMAGRYLSALEADVGARLVERSTRRLSLTDAGQAYFARGKRILEELQEADDEAADLQATPRGALRIVAPITFGATYLGPLTAAYMQEFPEVDVILHLQDRFVDLVEEGMDLAIRIGHLPDSDLVARTLGECRLMACASPAYLARAGAPRKPEDLSSQTLIGYLGAVTTTPWTFIDAKGLSTLLDVHCRFSANNAQVMLEVARAGFGIAYGPDFVFAEALSRRELVQVLPGYASPSLPVHAVTPTARHVNAKTRLYIERLRTAFATPAPWHCPPAPAPAQARRGRARPEQRRTKTRSSASTAKNP
jgi:DNA-binding transcriptional LysR family regulator